MHRLRQSIQGERWNLSRMVESAGMPRSAASSRRGPCDRTIQAAAHYPGCKEASHDVPAPRACSPPIAVQRRRRFRRCRSRTNPFVAPWLRRRRNQGRMRSAPQRRKSRAANHCASSDRRKETDPMPVVSFLSRFPDPARRYESLCTVRQCWFRSPSMYNCIRCFAEPSKAGIVEVCRHSGS